MISSYVGENEEFERQYLHGELEVELTPQVENPFVAFPPSGSTLNGFSLLQREPWLRG